MGEDPAVSDHDDLQLRHQIRLLEEEIEVLMRRIQDAPRRVRLLEERLLEARGRLAQASGQNEKLAAALDFDEISGTDEKLDYMHLFFELGDGNYLAFFDLPDSADEKKFRRKSGFNLHFAFEVGSMEEVDAFKKRFDRQVEAASRLSHPNVVCAVDAGSLLSVPDNLSLLQAAALPEAMMYVL